MRIVGGRFRGRSLVAPASRAVRPTSDRLRETVFNILEHRHGRACDGAQVLDLFAGTGALGFEALSRGAARVLFVDTGAEAQACLRASVAALGVAASTRLLSRSATALGARLDGPYDLAFLDPPYGHGLAAVAMRGLAAQGWLAPGALCIVEEQAAAEVTLPAGFVAVDRRVQGKTQLLLSRFTGPG